MLLLLLLVFDPVNEPVRMAASAPVPVLRQSISSEPSTSAVSLSMLFGVFNLCSGMPFSSCATVAIFYSFSRSILHIHRLVVTGKVSEPPRSLVVVILHNVLLTIYNNIL